MKDVVAKEEVRASDSSKKAYKRPRIVKYGSIAHRTHGPTVGTNTDTPMPKLGVG